MIGHGMVQDNRVRAVPDRLGYRSGAATPVTAMRRTRLVDLREAAEVTGRRIRPLRLQIVHML